MPPTTDELQTQIDAMKAFIGIDGYQAGQRRLREGYAARLQEVVAESQLVISEDLPAETLQAALAPHVRNMDLLKGRIDRLDRELGPSENGNRSARRRPKR